MPKKDKKFKVSNLLVILTMLLSGAGVGYFIGSLSVEKEASNSLPMLFVILLFIGVLLMIIFAIAVHEMGHVLAGIIQGFEFKSITVMIFSLKKEQGRLKFEWNFDVNTAGGLALCLPNSSKNLKQKFAWYAMGGPIASLLLAVIALSVYYVVLPEFSKASPLPYVIANQVAIAGFISIVLFIVTIIPAKAGGFQTDGARFFNLMKGGDAAELDVTLLTVITLSTTGTRPAQYPEARILAALELPIASNFKTYLHAFLYYYYLDNNVIEKARIHLDQYVALVEGIPKGYRDVAWLEKGYFTALYDENPEKAGEYLSHDTGSKAVSDDYRYRAKAALAFSQGKYENAAEWAQLAIDNAHKNIDKGLANAASEWMRNLQARTAAMNKKLSR